MRFSPGSGTGSGTGSVAVAGGSMDSSSGGDWGFDGGEGGEMRGWSEMESWPFIGGIRGLGFERGVRDKSDSVVVTVKQGLSR